MVTARTAGAHPDIEATHPLLHTLAHLPMAYDGSGDPSVRLGLPVGAGVWLAAHGLLGRQSGLIDDAWPRLERRTTPKRTMSRPPTTLAPTPDPSSVRRSRPT